MMTLIGDRKRITEAEKALLQQHMRTLKDDLKTETKRMSTVHGAALLTPVEKAYYEPALRKAAANLTPATNSHPLKSRWHTHLYVVRLDISHLLDQLERKYPDF